MAERVYELETESGIKYDLVFTDEPPDVSRVANLMLTFWEIKKRKEGALKLL